MNDPRITNRALLVCAAIVIAIAAVVVWKEYVRVLQAVPGLLALLLVALLFLLAAIAIGAVSRGKADEVVEAEERYWSAARRMGALFDSALDGIAFFDGDGRYVDVNPAGAALLGDTREQIVGKGIGRCSAAKACAESSRSRTRTESSARWRRRQCRSCSPICTPCSCTTSPRGRGPSARCRSSPHC